MIDNKFIQAALRANDAMWSPIEKAYHVIKFIRLILI